MTASPDLFSAASDTSTITTPGAVAAMVAAPTSTAITFFDFSIAAPMEGTPTEASLEGYRYDPKYDYYARAIAAGEPALLIGPPGSGKTKFFRYVAHKMGLRYFQQPHTAQTEQDDIMGSWEPGVVDNTPIWVWNAGELVDYYENGGFYNADEITAARQNTTHMYHPIVNREVIYVKSAGGIREVAPHPNFRFGATCNPWNQYEGNYEMGAPLFERFMPIRFDYISQELEEQVLATDGPDVPSGVITDLCTFANQIRQGYIASKGNQRYVLSTRVLRKMINHMQRFEATLDQVVAAFILTTLETKFPDEYDATVKILKEFIPLESAA